MTRSNLIFFCKDIPSCPKIKHILNERFDILEAKTKKGFITKINSFPVEGAVVCSCFSKTDDLDDFKKINDLTGPIPLFICSRIPKPDFLRKSLDLDLNRFFFCEEESEKISDIITETLQKRFLNEYIQLCSFELYHSSFHINKFFQLIINNFPKRLKIQEYANLVGINRRRLHNLCMEVIGITPTRIIRRIWIYQALHLMDRTDLSNLDIAERLLYSEESNMARDFRNEIDISPNEARTLLITKSAYEILNSKK